MVGSPLVATRAGAVRPSTAKLDSTINRWLPLTRVRIAQEAQAIFFRRRHQPRRPPPAKIRPGRPAPAMGPGTAVVDVPVPSSVNPSVAVNSVVSLNPPEPVESNARSLGDRVSEKNVATVGANMNVKTHVTDVAVNGTLAE